MAQTKYNNILDKNGVPKLNSKRKMEIPNK